MRTPTRKLIRFQFNLTRQLAARWQGRARSGSAPGAAAAAGPGPETAAIAEPKTIAVVYMIVTPGEDKEVVHKITFRDRKSFKDYLRDVNTSGLVRVPDEAEEQEEETVLIRDISDLEDGQRYRLCFPGQGNSISSIRQEHTHLTQRREYEAGKAVLRDVQREDPTCVFDPSVRVLKDSKGRDEVEVDAVIMCESQAIVLSHKMNYTGASVVKAIAADAQVITLKSSEAAYAGTRYGEFKGKKVVPAFVAESAAATTEANLRRAGQTYGVKLYRRNGSSISPWASMTPMKRVAARPAVMRWAV